MSFYYKHVTKLTCILTKPKCRLAVVKLATNKVHALEMIITAEKEETSC